MRTRHLRWQLSVGQAVLALALVFGGTVLLATRTDNLRQAEAAEGTQRDAEILAAQLGPLLDAGRPIDKVLTSSASRQVEITNPDGIHIAGDQISADPLVAATIEDVWLSIDESSTPIGIRIGNSVLGIQPVLVDNDLKGIVVVAEAAPSRRGWRELYGLDGWAAAVLCVAAAAMGWLLAGRITRPLSRLTDHARSLVLSGTPEPLPRSRITEIAVLGAAINRVGNRISREAGARDQLEQNLRRLSHELRTPLTTIRLRLDSLSELDDESRTDFHKSHENEVLDVIWGQLARLERLGEQLSQLRYSTPEAKAVDLALLATSAVDRLRPLAEWGRVELTLDTRRPARVIADHDALEDAISNVVENAIKHSPRGARVLVTTTSEPGWCGLEISDSGPGIAEGLREVILRPGVRIVGPNVVRGTGQGLAIVAATIDRYGGRLELADAPGGGALVRVLLPELVGLPDSPAPTTVSASSPAEVDACTPSQPIR